MTIIGWARNTFLSKRRSVNFFSVTTVEVDDPTKGLRIRFHDPRDNEFLVIEIEVAEWNKVNALVADHIVEIRNKNAKTLCLLCGEPQFETPSGITCKNGHGGAPSIEKA